MSVKVLAVRIGVDLKPLDAGLQQMNSKLDTAADQVKKRYGRIQEDIGRMGAALTVGVTLPIVGIGAAAIKSALSMDALTRGLQAVAGSGAEAKRQLKEIEELAKAPGVGYREAIQMATGLQAAGYSFEQVKNLTREVGNALAMVGKGKSELAGVNAQLIQMAGKGKLMMEDVRILMNYIPQLGKAMMAAYGTTDTEAISKSGVTAMQFVEDMTRELGKLQRVSGGVKNDLENLYDKLDQSLSDLGTKALPVVADVAKAGSDILDAWAKLPAPVQSLAIKMALVAAVAGPVISGVVKVWQVYSKGKAVLDASRTARLAAAAATTAETAALRGNTTAVVQNHAAHAIESAKGAAKVGILTKSLGVLKTVAMAALGALKWIATAVTTTFAGAAAAVAALVAGVLLGLSYLEGKKAKAANDALQMGKGVEHTAYKRTYSKHTTEQMERDLARQKELREQARVEMRKYEESGWWNKWQSGAKAERDMAKYQYDVANHRVIWLKKELEKRQEAVVKQKELTEEQQKALAQNAKRNQAAREEQYILAQTNEFARKEAQIRVDYSREVAEINERAQEALKEHGVALDVTDQINAAAARYTAAMKELNKEKSQVLAEARRSEQIAALQVEATRTNNEYIQRWSEALSEYGDAMAELAEEAEKGLDVTQRAALAYAKLQQAREQIGREAAAKASSERREEMFAGARATAINAGDKHSLAIYDAIEERVNSELRLRELAREGYDVTQRRAEADAKFNKAIRDANKQAADEATRIAKEEADRIKEAAQKRFDIRKDLHEAIADQWEIWGELTGNEKKGKLAAFDIRVKVKEAEIDRKIAETADPEEKAALAAQKHTLALEKQKNVLDILYGGIQGIVSKVQERKNSEMQAWKERVEYAKQYVEQLRQSVQFVGLNQAWENAQVSAIRASIQMPAIAPPPTENITGNDVRAALAELNNTNGQTNGLLATVIDELRNLGGGYAWNA